MLHQHLMTYNTVVFLSTRDGGPNSPLVSSDVTSVIRTGPRCPCRQGKAKAEEGLCMPLNIMSPRSPRVPTPPVTYPTKAGAKFTSSVSGCNSPKGNEILHLFMPAVHQVQQLFLFSLFPFSLSFTLIRKIQLGCSSCGAKILIQTPHLE